MGNSCRHSESQVISEAERRGERGRWSMVDGQTVDLDALIDAPSPVPSQPKKKHGKRKHKHRSRNRSTPRARDRDEERDRDADRERERERHPRKQSSTNVTSHFHRSPLDSDLILGSPPGSPEVIHARWGEPAEDPDEQTVCVDFRPNPFKMGWCVNCQRQHEVTESGVASKKEYKKIARPAVSKHAANALDNPDAVKNLSERRESDVDLAALLKQRRDILLKLNRLEHDKARRHGKNDRQPPATDPLRHSMLAPSERGSTLGKVLLIDSSSSRKPRGASVTTPSLEPPTLSKSVSLASSRLVPDDEFPIESQWL